MQLEIQLSNLQKRKIFVATPMYGGQCHGMYTKSSCDLAKITQHYQIETRFFYLFNESLITRARNYCVDEFLRSDYTHLMFIDSDIGFDPNDVITLAALADPEDEDPKTRKEIICGPYPKKTIAWEKIKRAVDKGFADANPGDLEKFVGDYVFNPTDEQSEIRIDEPAKVLEGGTGFMMIQRSAFEKFDKAYPDFSYRPDHIRTKHFDGSREIMMYFQALIDPRSKRYLSEDYMFCQWMRDIGVNTWMCPWMKLTHAGSYIFGGSLADLAVLGAAATADSELVKPMKK
jgi:hypothetical protein